MSTATSTNATYLTLVFRHEQEDQILSWLRDSFFDHHFTLLRSDTSEGTYPSSTSEQFTLGAQEKCLTGESSRPLETEHIHMLATFIHTGQLLGFVVRGEIRLARENERGQRVINNLKESCEQGVPVGENQHRKQEHPLPSEEEELSQHLSARDRYLLAIDTGTLEYYYDDLRREAFRRDEEKGRD